MNSQVEAIITITGPQADFTALLSGLILPVLFLNILWTGSIGSRAGLYLIDCPELLIQRISRGSKWTHTFLLFLSFALACSCESAFFIKTWESATQTGPQSSVQYCFIPCLILQIAIMFLLQATAIYRMLYLAGGKLRAATILQVTLHQVPLLACGVTFPLSILTSDSRRYGFLCAIVAVWFTHVVIVCVSLVISLKDVRGSAVLSEEERLVNWLSIGVAALNSVGYSLMILNVCWYIYSPSFIRLVLQIGLAKLHISFMAMLLHMCEDPTDGKQPDSGVRWAVSSQEEKRLREWLMGTSLV